VAVRQRAGGSDSVPALALATPGKGKLTKTAIASVINNTLAEIADQVKMGNKVQLTGCARQ
jgi:nucleoid DNA-binding protein